MSHLTTEQRGKLLKLLRLLGSDHLGERASAASRAHSMIASTGADWSDILAPAATADEMTVAKILQRRTALSEWDSKFVASISALLRSGIEISPRQRQQLNRISLEVYGVAA